MCQKDLKTSKANLEASAKTKAVKEKDEAPREGYGIQHPGILTGSCMMFVSMFAASLTFPFMQAQRDALGCDALCYGTMSSARSGLNLLGSMLVGRLSDTMGRKWALWVGFVSSLSSYLINLSGSSIVSMWIAIVPSALLNQNFSVLKALFADYNAQVDGTESQRTRAMGRLGMSVGLAFMVGPAVGAYTFRSYHEALLGALCFASLSGMLLWLLPPPQLSANGARKSSGSRCSSRSSSSSSSSLSENVCSSEDICKSAGDKESSGSSSSDSSCSNSSSSGNNEFDANKDHKVEKGKEDAKEKGIGFLDFLYLPTMQSPGVRLLLFTRLMMGLAFHIFMTVWTVSLKQRFDFGPREHAFFMGWIGLCYALAQGVLAGKFIAMAGEDPTNVLLLCVSVLGVGRVAAMATSSLAVVYATMAAVIVALGVMNSAITAAASKLAPPTERGGTMGVMESVESVAGLLGPTVGGLLFRLGEHVPIASVVSIYAVVFVTIYIFFRSSVVTALPPTRAATAGAKHKTE